MEKVEGAAAGLYVAALFESGRPDHRGLNTARLVRDARAATRSLAARGRLLRARFMTPRSYRFTSITVFRAPESSPRRPRPRGGAAAAGLVAVGGSKPRRRAAA